MEHQAATSVGTLHVTVITPTRGARLIAWRELWRYRELLWVLAARDVTVRYKQTLLGVAWAVIRPLAALVIFSTVFGRLSNMPSDGVPYPLFVYAGLLPWAFFANAVSSSGNSLVGSAHLVSKVYFPRLIVPVSSIASGVVDLVVSTAILLLLMFWYGSAWGAQLLLVPVPLAILFLAALGIGTFLAALTVAYRDFTHVSPFLIQVWMYATPVVFPVSLVPEMWRPLVFLNPMTGVVEGFRSAFLGRPLDAVGVAISFGVSVVLLVIGLSYFERVERRFADII